MCQVCRKTVRELILALVCIGLPVLSRKSSHEQRAWGTPAKAKGGGSVETCLRKS